jgi:hypothetical protein
LLSFTKSCRSYTYYSRNSWGPLHPLHLLHLLYFVSSFWMSCKQSQQLHQSLSFEASVTKTLEQYFEITSQRVFLVAIDF